jgi:predicted kinase
MSAELVALMGAPGAGKSTLAETYRERGYQVVGTDSLRSVNRPSAAVVRAVYEASYRAVAVHLFAGRPVCFDAPLQHAFTRARLRLLAARCRAPARLVVLHPPLDTCIARQQGRTLPASPEDVRTIHAAIEALLPTLAREGWWAVEVVGEA